MKVSTKKENEIVDIIIADNFPKGRFDRMSSALISRISKRQERFRIGKLNKQDLKIKLEIEGLKKLENINN